MVTMREINKPVKLWPLGGSLTQLDLLYTAIKTERNHHVSHVCSRSYIVDL